MIRMLQVNLLVPARTAYDKNATGEPLVLVHTLYSCKCIRCSRIYLVVIGLTLTHRHRYNAIRPTLCAGGRWASLVSSSSIPLGFFYPVAYPRNIDLMRFAINLILIACVPRIATLSLLLTAVQRYNILDMLLGQLKTPQ